MKRKKSIVTIGGGTGSFMLLSGLKNHDCELSAIVSMADDGGSTGALRDELGVLPPGDIRQCLIALSNAPETLRKLLTYRFEKGALKGHNFGNLFLSALEKTSGSYEHAIDEAIKLLNASGKVIPVTLDNARLRMLLNDGTLLKGENAISESIKIKKAGVKKYYFNPAVRANPEAIASIKAANIVTIGPGDHYASILPNLLITGIRTALQKTKAKIVYIPNLTNKKGQTNQYSTADYTYDIQKYLSARPIDYVMVNTKMPSERLMNKYRKQEGKYFWTTHQTPQLKKAQVIKGSFLSSAKISYSSSDAIAHQRSYIRHDGNKLAQSIIKIS